MNKFIYILPILVIIESFIAAIILAIDKKYGSSLYWFAASLVNFAAMFLIQRWG